MTVTPLVLVHGYGIGKIAPQLIKEAGVTGGFDGFRESVEKGDAFVFRWDVKVRCKIWDFINPIAEYNLYKRERKLAESTDIHAIFHTFLLEHAPKTIVCHSLGCYLLLNYLRKYDLPHSVTRVVFVQADLSRSAESIDKLSEKHIALINYYCPWDYVLLSSVLFNKYIPAGLFGLSGSYVFNKFHPLRGLLIHVSSIRDIGFANKILQP